MSLRAARCGISGCGRRIAARYLLIATVANLLWEVAQLPLYTIWQTATTGALAFAVAHCTAGDIIILATALVAALLLVGRHEFPRRGYIRVMLTATAFGVAYTTFSEWLNVQVWRSWAYATAMPTLPPLGTGLTPFLQWLVIPPLASVLVITNQRTGAKTS